MESENALECIGMHFQGSLQKSCEHLKISIHLQKSNGDPFERRFQRRSK